VKRRIKRMSQEQIPKLRKYWNPRRKRVLLLKILKMN
jgi:hypothetical protein